MHRRKQDSSRVLRYTHAVPILHSSYHILNFEALVEHFLDLWTAIVQYCRWIPHFIRHVFQIMMLVSSIGERGRLVLHCVA